MVIGVLSIRGCSTQIPYNRLASTPDSSSDIDDDDDDDDDDEALLFPNWYECM